MNKPSAGHLCFNSRIKALFSPLLPRKYPVEMLTEVRCKVYLVRSPNGGWNLKLYQQIKSNQAFRTDGDSQKAAVFCPDYLPYRLTFETFFFQLGYFLPQYTGTKPGDRKIKKAFLKPEYITLAQLPVNGILSYETTDTGPPIEMAPITKKRAAAKDDDFVLTLSDDENDRFDAVEAEEKDDGALSSSKKRKREGAEGAASKSTNKKVKKQQQQQQQKGKKGSQKPAVQEDNSEDGDEEEVEEGNADEDDGALDSDFEFDVGGVTNEVVEGFDGWGANGDDNEKKGDKKAIDIDDIISRRREKREKKAEKEKQKGKKQDDSSEGQEEEDEDDEAMSVDFEDDELLATDGFGMGADGAEESEAEGNECSDEESEDEDGEGSGDDDDDDDAASDNDSVATPVQHPDDMSGGESDAESDVDAEEEAKRKAFFAPEEQTNEISKDDGIKRSFQEFNLSRPILRGLAAVNFTNPTPIQQKTIPVALLGKDIVGSAVTGSGKTAAFVVPILERLLFRPRKVPTSRVAILMPTRELAVQCYNVATKLATYTDITFCQLVGGFSLREQENILKKRPDVIIATPGRFIDHMRNSASFTVDTLEILVLDEADRMLEDGFADELNEILTTIPKSRQTMLFSATMTDSVDKLIRVGLNRPVRLMVDSKKNTALTLVQEFVRLRPGREDKRLGYLVHLCKQVYIGRVIVFFRQKKEAHRVRIVFGLLGLKAAELHGSMSQEQVCRLFNIY